MVFKERLPVNCPPSGSHQNGHQGVYRLCSTNPPTATDFLSAAAKNEPAPPVVDLCRWSSCSLFTDLATVKKKRSTFKKLQKYGFAAVMTIPPKSGHSEQANAHIDFWMFDTFDPVNAVTKVETL
ncbi:hypothetical protein [Bradyrhizobium sp. STM 3566]|uniref:hypothetical protein n=1 Tax=Bradyrhizobium sp. STM 3566 TaxID=578928 RepID=UPI0038910703